jgi:hypothetical protein
MKQAPCCALINFFFKNYFLNYAKNHFYSHFLLTRCPVPLFIKETLLWSFFLVLIVKENNFKDIFVEKLLGIFLIISSESLLEVELSQSYTSF